MICIIFVAGHGLSLENEIKNHEKYSHLWGVPKALLPGVGGKKILDYWWEVLKIRRLFNEIYLVTNADKYKHFERWATASDFPVCNIINDGSTSNANRLGSVLDLEVVLKSKNVTDDIMVVAGDMLFQDDKFDLTQVVNYFYKKPEGELAICYEMLTEELSGLGTKRLNRGIIELDSCSNRVAKFLEKPQICDTESRLASVVFYCFRSQSLSLVSDFLNKHPCLDSRNFGTYMEWLVNTKKHPVYGMKLPCGFQLIGQVSLEDYEQWVNYFSRKRNHTATDVTITKRAYARVGLVGNPSDGFFGKTIALSIKNFWAEVKLTESEHLILMPHPLNDPTEFGSIADLFGISRKEGYFGGLRLLQATCKQFYEYCCEKGLALTKRNFTLKYDTNIPRQVGLAGSSAIVTATLKCLMEFYNITDLDMPKEFQPNFILRVEKEELFINAGLQDRVIQVYEGLTYMDFSEEYFKSHSHGNYERLPCNNLPLFWVAYVNDPSDSGRIHSDFFTRWQKGESEARESIQMFAQFTEEARKAIAVEDWHSLMKIMDSNFDLRRKVYGDAALGTANLRMIELARLHGSAAKFPGSGGAVVGLCLQNDKLVELKQSLQAEGFVFCELIPNI